MTFDVPSGGPTMAPRPPAVVAALFDGQCGVCTRSSAWFGAHDPEHRVERLDLRDPEAAVRFPGLDPDAVRAQLHVVDRTGAVVVGVDAVRVALAELPGWWLAAAALRVPGVRGVVGVAYRWFARNRLWFNRWFPLAEPPCTDACAVHPPAAAPPLRFPTAPGALRPPAE